MDKKEKFKVKTIIVDVLFDIMGASLYALAVYTFAAQADFAPGGITGLSIILHHFFEFVPIGMGTIIFNVPIVLLCYKRLGRKFLIKSLRTMIILALLTDIVFPLFPQYSGDRLLAAMFAGVLAGIGLSLVYMRGSSTGGTDFIIFSVRKKYPYVSIGSIALFTDGVIILLGGLTFRQVESVLFGIVMTAALTLTMDKLMYGMGSRKMTIVITTHGKEIAHRISAEVDRGSTIVNATGSFTGEQRQLLMCACNKAEAFEVRCIVREEDPKAIVMQSTVDEAYGYGFKKLDEQ